MKRRIIIALLLLSASIGFGPLTERGASARRAVPNPVVTNLNDSGAGSLRQAISDADAGSTITFQTGLTGAITLASQLTIDKNLTIQGPGANFLTISGNDAVRIFEITADNVTLSGLTIANGRATGEIAQGGGILYTSAGTLTLQQCALSDNSAHSSGAGNGPGSYVAGFGGGIYNRVGTVNLTACTLSNNSASARASVANVANVGRGGGIYNRDGTVNLTACTLSGNSTSASNFHAESFNSGGGIYNDDAGTVSLTACTLTDNYAAFYGIGGGIYTDIKPIIIRNTIIAGNWAGARGPDVSAHNGVTSQGYNLIGNNESVDGLEAGNPNANQDIVGTDASPIDPQLGPLADNGGPTMTMAPHPCSPAIDQGKSFGLSADQRGQTRPVDNPAIPPATGGDQSDIGAFEAPASLVCNTQPTISGATISRQQGAPGTVSPIANVNDAEDTPGSLSVIVTSVPAGVTITGLTNTGGEIAVNVAAACNAMLGPKTVGLKVTDNGGLTATASLTVNVMAETTPPVITLYGANPMTVECPYGFVDPGATASDNCAGSVAVTISGSVNTAVPGIYTITYSANDGRGNIAIKTRTVNVVDTAAPTLILKPDIQLWPPNHKYQTVTMSQMAQSVSDGCNTALSLNDVKIEKVTSDELDNAQGDSDGETTNDIVIAADCKSVQLRAERDEKKNGRVYVITLRVRDASGNTTRKDFKVSAPINQSGAAAVQETAALTKTSSCP